MMKQYHIYVFTKDDCAPCARLKDHVNSLPLDDQAELDFVPAKVEGQYTQLATELNVELTPTLVVVHENVQCEIHENGDEFCDQAEESVERLVGANNIIEHLNATLEAYTYARAE
jgi:hypothetical protein